MRDPEYGIYGTEGKHQLFCERVIYKDVPGIGYVKPGDKLVSFLSKKELLEALNGPYRYLKNDVINK